MKYLPKKPQVSLEDFQKLDIRLGEIISAEEVPNSRKLIKLGVDFGDHQRQILSGIKEERQDFKEVIGLQTLFIINLPPRKMAGLISEGMLLDVGYENGVLPGMMLPERPMDNGASAG